MTHRSGTVSRLAAALALAALLMPLLALRAGAADAVGMQARALVGGRFEASGWAAISVALSNEGEPLTGYLAADSEDGTVRRFVELPAGSNKVVALYLRPASFARTIEVRFESENGGRLGSTTADVRVLERTTGHVAVVGDGGGHLRPQLIARAAGLPEPIPMSVSDLPERPEPLRGLETIIWADDSATLGEAQRRSLERWIAAGGQLVVLGGPDWQARTAAFADLLPVENLGAHDDVEVAPLATFVGAEPPDDAAVLTAALGSLRTGAIPLVRSGSDILFAAVPRGAGRVGFLGFDLATEPFRAWAGAPLLWTRLVPDDRALQQFGGIGPTDDDLANVMTQALVNLPALDVPPAELLLALLLGYILLIGPISYLVLRRLDRRELAWITTPVLVILFTAATYAVGASMKGTDIVVHQVTIVRTSTNGTAASVSTFAGVFSPTRATYDLTVRGDALLSALRSSAVDPTLSGGTLYDTEQGDPAHLRGLAVSPFGMQAVRADEVQAYTPSLRVTWAVPPPQAGNALMAVAITGSVTNDSDAVVEDVAVVSQGGGVMVGTLAPGETKEFTLRNLSGASASQGVYGSVVFDPSSPTARRLLIRSLVIDGLVGYGGWGGRDGGPGAGGIDRGPFVIGWHPDDTTLAVELDGHQPQRYGQAVEVISGRPALGPGPVALAPSQLTTEIVGMAGDASNTEPGWVYLANGEVTFRVGVPLEATGLVPDKVTIFAANDSANIFWNQVEGMRLPEGFRLAVYDASASEWNDLGDLSVDSSFEIDDPPSVLDASGRILIKITGTDIPADLGQTPVFAGAAIEGVIVR